MRLARLLIGSFLPLLVLTVRPASSQREAPGTFAEVLEVRVVNVEVVVTDKEGKRIEGLGPGDFRLRVDGKETEIEFFNEVRGAAVIGGGDDADRPRRIPTLDPGQGVGTSYLVFIDDYYALARDRNQVLEKFREQIPLLGPEDRMAVVAFNGQRLDMLTTWTRAFETLDEVFRDAQGRQAFGMQRNAERRTEDQLLRDSTRSPASVNRLDTDERYYVDRKIDEVERLVTAAASTLRSFAQPPGRKVMVMLSGGWPYDPVQWVVDDITRPIAEPGMPTGDELFAPLSDTANLLGYTLYTIDVPGLQVGTVDAAISPRVAEENSPITTVSFYRESELHNSLNFLADETGGRAMINGQRLDAFSAVVADTRSYYWIGFTPGREGDDSRHRIEVEVLRPGLRVRSRDGFFDFSRSREVNMAIESALYFGNPPSPQPLLVQVGRPENDGRRRMIVPLVVAIPTDSITLLPTGPGELTAQLELRVAVLDEDGASAGEIPVIPIGFKLTKPPQPGAFVRYDTSLKMRRKHHDVVVALYDTSSGAILSTSVEVAPQ